MWDERDSKKRKGLELNLALRHSIFDFGLAFSRPI
jgi:hypothetical protein